MKLKQAIALAKKNTSSIQKLEAKVKEIFNIIEDTETSFSKEMDELERDHVKEIEALEEQVKVLDKKIDELDINPLDQTDWREWPTSPVFEAAKKAGACNDVYTLLDYETLGDIVKNNQYENTDKFLVWLRSKPFESKASKNITLKTLKSSDLTKALQLKLINFECEI